MKFLHLTLLLFTLGYIPGNLGSEYPSSPTSVTVPAAADRDERAMINLVFKSYDGGQTWQDISEGLPQTAVDKSGSHRFTFFANDRGLYINVGNGIYHNEPGSKTFFWNKEIFWKDAQDEGSGRLAESNGVLIATNQKGIVRSTDAGKNWELVISEGGVGIAVERINGGFAAITYNTVSKTRRVRTSYDGGKTWKAIDDNLPASASIASIIEVGGNFFCGHPDGIFRSSDNGNTWKLLLPSVENMVFNLCVSGNMIYAIPMPGGC